MAYCDVCGNFDDEHTDGEPSIKHYQIINQNYIIIGTEIFVKRITTGDVSFLKLIVCAKSVLT